jgi:hypothetical protein
MTNDTQAQCRVSDVVESDAEDDSRTMNVRGTATATARAQPSLSIGLINLIADGFLYTSDCREQRRSPPVDDR